METYNEMKELILSLSKDVDKVFNKTQLEAAIRIRKEMQKLRLMAKKFRKEIREALVNTEFKDDE